MSGVREILQDRELFHVGENDTVASVVRRMAEIHVGAILVLDGEQLQAGLTSKVLLVWLSSSSQGLSIQVVLMVAREGVRAQTAPDAAGVTKTISCGVLTAHRLAATGLWQSIVAEEDAVLESFGSGSAAVSNRLAATTVTAHFSSVTNQLENAVAEGAVVFAQTAPGKSLHTTGDRAVYTTAPEEQVELTGHPWAQTDRLTILDADRLKYDLKSGAVDASGQYHLVFPKRMAANAPAMSTRCITRPPSRKPSGLASFGSAISEYSDADARTGRPASGAGSGLGADVMDGSPPMWAV